MFSENVNVIVAQPKCVGGKHVRAQNSESVQIFDRGEASVKFLAVSNFLFSLTDMNVNFQAMFPCEFRYPKHQFFTCGVDCMNGSLEDSVILKREGFLIDFMHLLLLALCLFMVIVVERYV